MVVLFEVFSDGMVLLLQGADANLGMGMQIKDKDMFLQGNKIPAEFHYKGLMVAM